MALSKRKNIIERRPGQHNFESAAEYIMRIGSNLTMEHGSIMDDLPCVQSVIEFFELWHAYDTDFISGVIECIDEGDSPKAYNAFVKKWRLPWILKQQVRKAVKA